MNLKLYKATGAAITTLRRCLDVELSVSGAEHIPERPTLFAVNHFTRMETLLVPYVVYHALGRPVHILATPSLFRGLLAKYLRAVGVMSVRHPRRNRTIIGELMTGSMDWVIYPEGRLVKNKKTVRGRRLELDHPERKGPPHTGAAMLALKAEISKRRYLDACARGHADRAKFYQEQYDLSGPDEISPLGTIVVPTNFTFYPLRPAPNLINRLMRLLGREVDPVMDEEMQVEGRILLGNCRISVHFGEPLEVSEYLGRATEMARRVMGVFSERGRDDLLLRRQATRLTADCMRRIYGSTEINFDHLFCSGLRALKQDRVPAEDFHRALYLAALELQEQGRLRLHPRLRQGLGKLVTNEPFAALDSVVKLAQSQDIVRRENGSYLVDREVLHAAHDINTVRLRNTVQVIANELEPLHDAVETVRRAVNLSSEELRRRTSDAVVRTDARAFEREYETWHMPGVSRPRDEAAPYLLEAPGSRIGVVLAHGYLSTPRQMRPLAEFLHGRGASVYAVRLSGHGTAPKHLTDVGWTDWVGSLHAGYAALRPHCDRIVVGGFSLGAVLALLVAAGGAPEVDGVFAINAPLRLRDRRASLVPALVQWNRVAGGLGLAAASGMLSNHDTESPDLNYTVDYLQGVRELRRAVTACKRGLRSITAPALIIQGDADPVVSPESGRLACRGIGADRCRLLTLPFDRHDVIRGRGSEAIFEAVAEFVLGERAEAPA